MSDDLIKRVCQSWVDAGWGDDPFWEHWPECPTDDTLSAKQVLDRIEELERQLDFAVGVVAEVVAESGKQRGEAEAKLAKAVEALRDATQMLSQCTFTNIRIRGQYFERQEVVDKANAVLAELEKES
jgi:hypothetical protein